MKSRWVSAHGDEVEADRRDDGWYWRWTSPYAPSEDWHGPNESLEACHDAEVQS